MTGKKVPKAAFMARKGKERRRWKRILAKIRVILKDSDTFVPLITRNINPGGMFLQTDEPKARLELVTLRIDMGKGQPPLSVLGVVKHSVDKIRARELNRIPGMGIQFYGMSDSDQKRWNLLVAKIAAVSQGKEDKLQASDGEPRARQVRLPLVSTPTSGASEPDDQRFVSDSFEVDEPFEVEKPLDLGEPLEVEEPLDLDEPLGVEEPFDLDSPLGAAKRYPPEEVDSEMDTDLQEELAFLGEGLAELLEEEEPEPGPLDLDPDSRSLMEMLDNGSRPLTSEGLADLFRSEGAERLEKETTSEVSRDVNHSQQDLAPLFPEGLAEMLEGEREEPPESPSEPEADRIEGGQVDIRPLDVEELRGFIDRDVDLGVTFIPTDELLDVGVRVRVRLIHPETEEAFPFEGKVSRVDREAGQPRGIQVRFVGLTERHKEGLEKFVIYGFNIL